MIAEWILAITFTLIVILAVMSVAKAVLVNDERRAARRRNQARPWKF